MHGNHFLVVVLLFEEEKVERAGRDRVPESRGVILLEPTAATASVYSSMARCT